MHLTGGRPVGKKRPTGFGMLLMGRLGQSRPISHSPGELPLVFVQAHHRFSCSTCDRPAPFAAGNTRGRPGLHRLQPVVMGLVVVPFTGDVLALTLHFIPWDMTLVHLRCVCRAWDETIMGAFPVRFLTPPITPCGFSISYQVCSVHGYNQSYYDLNIHIHSFSTAAQGAQPSVAQHPGNSGAAALGPSRASDAGAGAGAGAGPSACGGGSAGAHASETDGGVVVSDAGVTCQEGGGSTPKWPSYVRFHCVHQGDGYNEQPQVCKPLGAAQGVRLWRWLQRLQRKRHLFVSEAQAAEEDYTVKQENLYLYHGSLSVREGDCVTHESLNRDFAWTAFTGLVWRHVFRSPDTGKRRGRNALRIESAPAAAAGAGADAGVARNAVE